MTRKGVDSSSVPTADQVRTAVQQGVTWWGFYVLGPGAYHNWPADGVDVLRQGGITEGLPIYVPAMAYGRISSRTPEEDANAFVAAYRALGVVGAGALDTEASMRDDAWTAQYEERFSAQLRSLGEKDVCYAGGFNMSAPPTATYKWWIVASDTPPSRCAYQSGDTTLGGLSVDIDYAADDFPLASLLTPPPLPNGADMQSPLIWVPAAEAPNSAPFFAYYDKDGHLVQIAWTPDGTKNWHSWDLTVASGANPAAVS